MSAIRKACRAARAARRLVVLFVAASCVLFVAPLADARTVLPFFVLSAGDFVINFAAGPDMTDDLRFSGDALATFLGQSELDGHSTTRTDPEDPSVSEIVTDEVILTAASGDEIRLSNSGEDHLDTSDPAHPVIRGSGTFVITGGAGRFRGAAGHGVFLVYAEVTEFGPASVGGEYVLAFDGVLSLPR